MKITNLIRVLLVVLSCVMVLSLFACGNEAGTDTEATTTEAADNNETTEGGNATEATEGRNDTDVTEGGNDTEATEGSNNTEATEGGNDTQNTETNDTESTETDGESGDVIETVAFLSAIETVFGNDATNPANVTIFQATPDGNPAPIMGNSTVSVLGAGHPNMPAEGIAPIALDSPTGFGGMIGFAGWGVFEGSVPAEVSVSYQITDAEGNVLVEWTAVQDILGAGVVGARTDVDAVLPAMGVNYSGNAFSVMCIVKTTDHSAELGGQSVNFNFAYTTAGDTEAVYVHFATFAGIVIPAAQ